MMASMSIALADKRVPVKWVSRTGLQDLMVGGTEDKVAGRIENILTAGGEALFESQLRRKDGSVFDVEISAQYQPGDGGRLVSFLRDITERKQKEAQTLLEQAVEERTKQLRRETDASPTEGADTIGHRHDGGGAVTDLHGIHPGRYVQGKALRGTLQVESVYGKGSLFTVLVTFPIAQGFVRMKSELKTPPTNFTSAPITPVTPPKPERPPGDMAELQTLLEQMKTPLDNGEPRPCKDILAVLLAKSWPEEQETLLAELNRLVNRYRLQEALDLLNQE